jgi:hypothetical protein
MIPVHLVVIRRSLYLSLFMASGITARRYGIMAVTPPGVAPYDPPERQVGTFDQSMHAQCFDGILGARGYIPAGCREPGRYDPLIQPDRYDDRFNQDLSHDNRYPSHHNGNNDAYGASNILDIHNF